MIHPQSCQYSHKRSGENIDQEMLGEVHPDAVNNFKLDTRAYVFELDFELLSALASQEKHYIPLPRFPSADRDLAGIVSEDVSAAELEEEIVKAGGEILASYRMFDIYRGKQVPDNKKSMAYSLIYQASNRTLTDEVINSKHEEVKQRLVERFGAELR
jgi:phenylalanyl-tRNA synthetase beta chain